MSTDLTYFLLVVGAFALIVWGAYRLRARVDTWAARRRYARKVRAHALAHSTGHPAGRAYRS